MFLSKEREGETSASRSRERERERRRCLCLTRGGRGTRVGRGPRWRRCWRMICCGRRRWWVCRVSTDLACLLQHLVYGVHVCPHETYRDTNSDIARGAFFSFCSLLSRSSFRLSHTFLHSFSTRSNPPLGQQVSSRAIILRLRFQWRCTSRFDGIILLIYYILNYLFVAMFIRLHLYLSEWVWR